MRVATLRDGGRDGTLVVVSPDHTRGVVAPSGIRTLQAALDNWSECEPLLSEVCDRLATREDEGVQIDLRELASPLPRAYQWCEGSTFLPHMERMRASRGHALPPRHNAEPIVYQSGSDGFLAPTAPIPLRDESWELDLEATVAVVTDDVPIGVTCDEAASHIKFVMLTNDLTFRGLLGDELKKGLGLFHSKPARAFAPIAVSPEALGEAWRDGLLSANVRCWVDEKLLGDLRADQDCAFDFHRLISYMTMTRALGPGTIVGSGTVANADPARGYGCLGEKRAGEIIESGHAQTDYLRSGQTVRIDAVDGTGRSLFGSLEQQIVSTS